jgi:D-serine deaminase-like pyridoxal phosphate-dependent protein
MRGSHHFRALPLGIQRPTLLLDKDKAIHNIEKMAGKARKSGVRFRPHFKTHRSAGVAEWFRDFDVDAITVSSLEMAAYFADHGWGDITVAFPVNLLEIDKVNSLAAEIALGLLVESKEAVQFLAAHLGHKVSTWIKVDIGYGRTGVSWDRPGEIVELAQALAATDRLAFRGLLTHAGHSYHAASKLELEAIHRDSLARLVHVRAALLAEGFSQVELSSGDTPTCSVVDDFAGLDEIRPGNFVFYDLKQVMIGACSERDIAVAVACPVVAKHPQRNEIVLYGGAVHLSKESFVRADGTPTFGHVAFWEGDGWGPSLPDTYVSSLSQEHGIVRTTVDVLDQVHVGDVLIIVPVHSCLLSYLLNDYHTLDGEIIPSQSTVGVHT